MANETKLTNCNRQDDRHNSVNAFIHSTDTAFSGGLLQKSGYPEAIITAKLAEMGIAEATLTAMQSGFKKLEMREKAYTTEPGEAQEATVAGDTAWDALEDWMHIFY